MTAPAFSRLESLASRISATARAGTNVVSIALGAIKPNPRQPRKTFDETRLEQLAVSIQKNGIVQPLIVTATGAGHYELVAGERRWRAAQIAGLPDVPAIVRDAKQINKLVLALIENLDREDMTPFDEARGIAELVAETNVQEAANTLGRTKQWISKRQRIAKAPGFVQKFVESGAVRDVEALYELAKLADEEPAQAKHAIASYTPGAHLREQLKAARRHSENSSNPPFPKEIDPDARPPASLDAPGPSPDNEPSTCHGRAVAKEKVSRTRLPADRSPSMKVEAVFRRARDLFLVTGDSEIRVEFSAQAQQQLVKYLDEAK